MLGVRGVWGRVEGVSEAGRGTVGFSGCSPEGVRLEAAREETAMGPHLWGAAGHWQRGGMVVLHGLAPGGGQGRQIDSRWQRPQPVSPPPSARGWQCLLTFAHWGSLTGVGRPICGVLRLAPTSRRVPRGQPQPQGTCRSTCARGWVEKRRVGGLDAGHVQHRMVANTGLAWDGLLEGPPQVCRVGWALGGSQGRGAGPVCELCCCTEPGLWGWWVHGLLPKGSQERGHHSYLTIHSFIHSARVCVESLPQSYNPPNIKFNRKTEATYWCNKVQNDDYWHPLKKKKPNS